MSSVAAIVLAIAAAIPAQAAPITVFLRTVSGQQFALNVDSTDTIAVFKQVVETATGTPVADQRLIYGGRQLEDGRTLADYNVLDQSIIRLVRRLTGSSGSSASINEPPPIPIWFQSYGRTSALDICLTGWNPSWAQWPHGGAGGWTCDRSIPALG